MRSYFWSVFFCIRTEQLHLRGYFREWRGVSLIQSVGKKAAHNTETVRWSIFLFKLNLNIVISQRFLKILFLFQLLLDTVGNDPCESIILNFYYSALIAIFENGQHSSCLFCEIKAGLLVYFLLASANTFIRQHEIKIALIT